MPKKIPLKQIIESVLKNDRIENYSQEEYDKYEDDLEKNIRNLYRKFDKLLRRLGCDKEVFKARGHGMEFDESELPFMKALLIQLRDNQGIIAQFVNDTSASKTFSSREVRDLIQSVVDEADKSGMNEDELTGLAGFLECLFFCSPLRSIEHCHVLIDGLASNLQDLPSSVQAVYLSKVEHILKKEYALRVAESTFQIIDLATLVSNDDFDVSPYYEQDPEICIEYMQRDAAVLKRIQEDNDLRKYIETVLGKKAEEIFNYVSK